MNQSSRFVHPTGTGWTNRSPHRLLQSSWTASSRRARRYRPERDLAEQLGLEPHARCAKAWHAFYTRPSSRPGKAAATWSGTRRGLTHPAVVVGVSVQTGAASRCWRSALLGPAMGGLAAERRPPEDAEAGGAALAAVREGRRAPWRARSPISPTSVSSSTAPINPRAGVAWVRLGLAPGAAESTSPPPGPTRTRGRRRLAWALLLRPR